MTQTFVSCLANEMSDLPLLASMGDTDIEQKLKINIKK